MGNRTVETSPQVYARVSGLLYLIIFIAAIFGPIYVRGNLILPEDAALTANKITTSESLFNAGIASYFVIILSEIVLSVLLYELLKPVNKTLSLIAMVSRLVMTTIHGINLINQFFALMLLSGAAYLSVFEGEQLNALALLFLNAYDYGALIWGTFFSLHLLVMATPASQVEVFSQISGGGVCPCMPGLFCRQLRTFSAAPIRSDIFRDRLVDGACGTGICLLALDQGFERRKVERTYGCC